ncbi:MAG TPA: methyltransferase [Sulfurimonas sp. UBA12504]|nr:MAG: methyltransferase [Sulfurimonas sp. GWF2_37_8]DAB30493.1 MAG TPA: methyltransferase [Sulfurimonas sp. UBA12504]
MTQEHKCSLCSHQAKLFYQDKTKRFECDYFLCETCHSIFADSAKLPNAAKEKERYELHDDNVEDKGYQKFVSPMTQAIQEEYKRSAKGLDFGAGRAPIVSKLMQSAGYDIEQYDPFFHPNAALLKKKYDYVAACEVVEHFYHPHKEFGLLKSLLDEDAKLYIMTDLYDTSIDFAKWYYKNDMTHVFFYSQESFEWIQKEFGFKSLQIEKRLVIFS